MTYILQLQLQRQLHHTTLHCTALPLDYTTATPQTAATTTRTTTATATATATTQHYTDCTTLQLQVHYTRTTTTLRYNYNYNHNNNYNYACTYTTHWNTQQLQLRYTTLPLTLQLHNYNYTTLYPAVVGEMTTATTPRSTTLTTFRVISGFALPSMRRNNSPLLWCPMIETSATALCAAQLVLLDVYRDDMIWYDTIWCDVMWPDISYQWLCTNTNMIRHVCSSVDGQVRTSFRSFSSSNAQADATQHYHLPACIKNMSMAQFSRNDVVQEGFVASP